MSKVPEWAEWEHDVQSLLGLDSTPGSGNQFNAPGDAVDNSHDGSFRPIVDCKFSSKLSYSLKRADWEDWLEKGAELGKRSMMAVRIWSRGLNCPMDVMIVDMNDFAELLARSEKLDLIEKLYRQPEPVIDRTFLERDECYERRHL